MFIAKTGRLENPELYLYLVPPAFALAYAIVLIGCIGIIRTQAPREPPEPITREQDRPIAGVRRAAGILCKANLANPPPHGEREITAIMTMSETPQTQTPITAPPISTERLVTVTEAAGQKVLELRSREGKENARLRLFVKWVAAPASVTGWPSTIDLADDDRVEHHGGVPVVIDKFSAQYVDGAEIDYVDSLMGSGFAINNPNAVSSCACGSSFNTDGSPSKAGGCAH